MSSDYTPLDINRWSNGNASSIKGPFGPQVLRGLPFKISPIQFNKMHNRPIEIPIQSLTQWIIIAHRLDESYLLEGEPVGHVVAHYCFQIQNGATLAVPIRERFEIGYAPPQFDLKYFGHQPFLAVPDRFDSLMPRDSGRSEERR